MIGDVTLSLADYGVFAAMITAASGVVATLMAAVLRGQARRIDAVEVSIKDVERNKADKHEWARETLLTRNKLDTVNENLARLEGKLDANYGIAAVANRIAEELKRTRVEQTPGHAVGI